MKEIRISEQLVLVEGERVGPARLSEIREIVISAQRKMFAESQESKRRWISEDFRKPLFLRTVKVEI